MKREDALKKVQEGLTALNEALAQGRSAELEQYLSVMGRFHKYSFGNVIMILCQNPDATHVAGFHKWLELHRYVKKGEKGIAILAPLVYKQKADDDGDSSDSDRVVRGFKVVHVFDVSQTEGEPLPELDSVQGDPGEKLDRLVAVIAEQGIELVTERLPGGTLGRSEGGRIVLAPELSAPERFAVGVHELAHELLHRGERRQETTKLIRETEAEAVAFVVCQAFGLESKRRSADYIQLYRGSVEALSESLDFIQKTATWIIEQLGSSATPSENEETPLRVGRADYAERRNARLARYEELDEKRSQQAEATHAEARQMASVIPFGQPILVGHHSEKRDRNYRERIHNKFGKSFELAAKARYFEEKARTVETNRAVSSDDPEAILKLNDKLAQLEASQAHMKQVNAAWRKAGEPLPNDQQAWQRVADLLGESFAELDELRLDAAQRYAWCKDAVPYPGYALSNQSAEIRRVKARIEQLTKAAAREVVDVGYGEFRYVEDVDENRVEFLFAGKPPQATRDLLKQQGFRWSRKSGAWQRLLNDAGRYAARVVINQLTQEQQA